MVSFVVNKDVQNKRPPYWNTSSDFDFDYVTVIAMLFCTKLPNFI